ncbi:class I SAM-dependent methyltransferase [Pseudoalteromonas piscicida]|uniref:class I SAM-dependent methyltransferase n=1 Tax=Pseudoalteromonas piscicida TaxID=43662 RepID=UPI003098B531
MILDKNWRILTVGDGDLSFSYSLAKHFKPATLIASVYDSEAELKLKYQDNAFDKLSDLGIRIVTQFDVTNLSCWQKIPLHAFDAVIFQFPLLPAFGSHQCFQQQTLSVNTLNRRLLRKFLINTTSYALDPHGEQLGIITSKDVKPYIEWNIEESLVIGTAHHYLGQSTFDISQFPEYQIRNVDRDKHVKDTSGISYYWSINKQHAIIPQLILPRYLNADHCTMCRAGPFISDNDKKAHNKAKKHKNMQKHEYEWLDYLQRTNTK